VDEEAANRIDHHFFTAPIKNLQKKAKLNPLSPNYPQNTF